MEGGEELECTVALPGPVGQLLSVFRYLVHEEREGSSLLCGHPDLDVRTRHSELKIPPYPVMPHFFSICQQNLQLENGADHRYEDVYTVTLDMQY